MLFCIDANFLFICDNKFKYYTHAQWAMSNEQWAWAWYENIPKIEHENGCHGCFRYVIWIDMKMVLCSTNNEIWKLNIFFSDDYYYYWLSKQASK